MGKNNWKRIEKIEKEIEDFKLYMLNQEIADDFYYGGKRRSDLEHLRELKQEIQRLEDEDNNVE